MSTSKTLYYTILAGNTYSGIANGVNRVAGVTIDQISASNPGIDPRKLVIGALLNLPDSNTGETALRYTIQAGDSYSRLSQAFAKSLRGGLTLEELQAANPNSPARSLQIGERIVIPIAGEVQASSIGNASVHGATTSVNRSAQTLNEGNSDGEVDTSTGNDSQVIGYYDKTWSPGLGPEGTNMSVAFSGYASVEQALASSKQVFASLPGEKYISLGGGAVATGSMTEASLQAIINGIGNGSFAGYQGICFDVEVGDSGLENTFEQAFVTAKSNGFKVLVTVSHSEPYGISDTKTLMASFLESQNIDILSPQLYSSGSESANDYTAIGTPWTAYANAKAVVAPSIVKASYYADAVSYFAGKGVTLGGFIQWKTIH